MYHKFSTTAERKLRQQQSEAIYMGSKRREHCAMSLWWFCWMASSSGKLSAHTALASRVCIVRKISQPKVIDGWLDIKYIKSFSYSISKQRVFIVSKVSWPKITDSWLDKKLKFQLTIAPQISRMITKSSDLNFLQRQPIPTYRSPYWTVVIPKIASNLK